MTAISVAILDAFHPRIVDTINGSLPPSWRCIVAEGADLAQQRAALLHADVAFVMAMPMGKALLEAAPKLRFIQKLGAGTDRIDISTCRARGITVARLHAGNAIPVAEHALLLMLAVCRRLPLMDRRTRAGDWDKEDARGNSRHLHGKRIGIVGFGAIGQALSKLLAGFGVDIVYYDPVVPHAGSCASSKARPLEFDELLATSDVVTLHLPLLPETVGIIGAAQIARMKPGAILVNCARGGLVDEEALAVALATGRLLGAGLDVFHHEPPIGSPLLSSDRTVVTPHLAGATLDNFASVLERAVENTKRYLRGDELPSGDIVYAPTSPR